MEVETRADWPAGFMELQWPVWRLMLCYDFYSLRFGIGYRDAGGPCFSLNFLCFDVHLHC